MFKVGDKVKWIAPDETVIVDTGDWNGCFMDLDVQYGDQFTIAEVKDEGRLYSLRNHNGKEFTMLGYVSSKYIAHV